SLIDRHDGGLFFIGGMCHRGVEIGIQAYTLLTVGSLAENKCKADSECSCPRRKHRNLAHLLPKPLAVAGRFTTFPKNQKLVILFALVATTTNDTTNQTHHECDAQ